MSKSLNKLLNELGLTMQNVKDRKYQVVATKKQFDIVFDRIMHRSNKNALHVKIKQLFGNLSTSTSIDGVSSSSIVKFHSKYDIDKLEVRNESNKRIRKLNGTMEYLTVNFEDTNTIRDLLSKIIYVIIGKNSRCYYYVKDEVGFLCLNNSTINKAKCIEDIADELNGTLYRFISFLPSPSGARNNSYLFVQLENEDPSEIEQRYDKATCGAYTLFKDNIKNRQLSGEDPGKIVTDMIKGIVRLSAKQAPSVCLGQLRGMALLEGYFENNSKELFYNEVIQMKEEQLQVAYLKNQITKSKFDEVLGRLDNAMYEKIKCVKGKVQDGEGITSNMYVSKMIFKEFGILIDPDLLIGLVWQIRPATAKISVIIVEEKCFKQILKGAKAFGEITNYGDPNDIGLLLDRKGLKMDIDPEKFKECCTFDVLATAKISSGKTSKQILRIAFNYAINPEVTASICNKAMEFVMGDRERSIRTMANDTDLTLLKEVDKTLKSNYYKMLELKYNPNIINESPVFYKNTYRQSISTHTNDIDGINIPLNMENRRMVADLTFIITGNKVNGLLKMDECYINNPNREHVIFFKYPLQGLEEYYSLSNTFSSIEGQIDGLYSSGIIDEDERDALVSFFTTISEKVIILPSSLHLMHTCAGSDFDYDGGACLFRVKTVNNPVDALSNHLFDLFKDNFKFKGVDILPKDLCKK